MKGNHATFTFGKQGWHHLIPLEAQTLTDSSNRDMFIFYSEVATPHDKSSYPSSEEQRLPQTLPPQPKMASS
jgi:hypothetical protein